MYDPWLGAFAINDTVEKTDETWIGVCGLNDSAY